MNFSTNVQSLCVFLLWFTWNLALVELIVDERTQTIIMETMAFVMFLFKNLKIPIPRVAHARLDGMEF